MKDSRCHQGDVNHLIDFVLSTRLVKDVKVVLDGARPIVVCGGHHRNLSGERLQLRVRGLSHPQVDQSTLVGLNGVLVLVIGEEDISKGVGGLGSELADDGRHGRGLALKPV